MYDEKTGRYVDNPNTSKEKYRRSKAERKKALERDANDLNSDLTPEAKDYIKKHKGNKVPDKKYNKDYEGKPMGSDSIEITQYAMLSSLP